MLLSAIILLKSFTHTPTLFKELLLLRLKEFIIIIALGAEAFPSSSPGLVVFL